MRSVNKASALAALVGALGWLVPGFAAAAGSLLDQGTITDYGEMIARSAGTAECSGSWRRDCPGIFLNPAAIATTHVYHIEGTGEYTPETERGFSVPPSWTPVPFRLACWFSIQGILLPMDSVSSSTSLDLRLASSPHRRPLHRRHLRALPQDHAGRRADRHGFGSSFQFRSRGPDFDLDPTESLGPRQHLHVRCGADLLPNDSIYIAVITMCKPHVCQQRLPCR